MNSSFVLKKYNEEDFFLYFLLVNNEKVMEQITQRAIQYNEALSDFDRVLTSNSKDNNFGTFKIYDSRTNEYIGLAKLEIKDEDPPVAELGYMLLPQYWGQGIGSQVCEKLVIMAKSSKFIHSVFAVIDPKNLASKRILLKTGFQYREFREIDGAPSELLELIITKKTYCLVD